MDNKFYYYLLLIISLVLCTVSAVRDTSGWQQVELGDYNPVATPDMYVISGSARFTVLTDRMIRMEYDPNGKFEDRATIAVVNRAFSPPTKFTSTNSNGGVVITTGSIQLTYTGGPFTQQSLTVTSIDTTSKFNSWYYGQPDPLNLLGTIRTLDLQDVVPLNCTLNANNNVHDESMHCEWGLISRSGWAIIDESGVPVLDSNYWWNGNNNNQIDIYLLAHGLSYKDAIGDYIKIGGRISMMPKYAGGIMFTRWYNYNNLNVKMEVESFSRHSFPLDVFIFDMNWHTKNDWTGYTFDSNLLPFPQYTLEYLHEQGLHISGNIHDANGVNWWEEQYTALCDTLGLSPNNKDSIPLNLIDETHAYAVEDVVMKPLIDTGMDFWWIDWQQGGAMGGLSGGKQNPTLWLNHLRSTDRLRNGDKTRGFVLGRFGGLGNHRYQAGFSGDVNALTWSNLAYQPYFSFTASNVGYGYWSHDLEGPNDDYEMYIRWVQWISYSGIFRMHDRGMSAGTCDITDTCSYVEPWNIPFKYSEMNRKVMTTRASLIPYIYNASRQAYDTGICLIRPMYYEYPQFDMAYAGNENGDYAQYMFGDDMLIAPIVTPGINGTMTEKSVWIPPGIWYEKETGVLINGASDGSTILSKYYDISETPVFIRGGSIIPSIPVITGNTIGLAAKQYESLILSIYPGSASRMVSFYEDDGDTTNYYTAKSGTASAWTIFEYKRTTTLFNMTIGAAVGTYSGMPSQRAYTIKLLNAPAALKVTVNNIVYPWSVFGGVGTWSYDGEGVTLVVQLTPTAVTSRVNILITTDNYDDSIFSGIKGIYSHGVVAKEALDEARITPGQNSGNPEPAELSSLISSGLSMTYLSGSDYKSYQSLLSSIPTMYAAALDELQSNIPNKYAFMQMFNQDRSDSMLCGTQDCINTNYYYAYLRVEGYHPEAGAPGTVPLNAFFNPDLNDNWVTTATSVDAGYTAAVFSNAYVYTSKVANSVPLQLYFNADRNDHLTVASPDGIQYAKDNNYVLVDSCLGYILSVSPELGDDYFADLFQYAYALMKQSSI